MYKPLLTFTAILSSTTLLTVKSVKAQITDTSKIAFQLGQVNILGTIDTLRANKLNSEVMNHYNRLDVSQARIHYRPVRLCRRLQRAGQEKNFRRGKRRGHQASRGAPFRRRKVERGFVR